MNSTRTPTPPTAAAGAAFWAHGQGRGTAAASAERTDAIPRALLDAVHRVVSDHEVTYPKSQCPEFQAARNRLMEVDEWVADDVARATGPELILRPVADGEDGLVQRYGFVLERA
ncbi:hypothetical protein [Streptomyces sp. NPDC056061]|uniref:hypothetical protein n=1 Tax=Streptomyces sp. NPDC056061 TaxID=3345700 RepID=UPI0035DAD733